MNTYFTSWLLGRNADEYNPELVKGWLKKSPFPNLFTKYRRLFFPLSFKDNHWALVMVDLTKNQVVYFDSLPKKEYHWEEAPQDKIFKFICQLAEDKGIKKFDPELWDCFEAFDSNDFQLSGQRDDVSCGVYTICYADLLSIKHETHHKKRFNLDSYINDEKILSLSMRATIFALIMKFEVDLSTEVEMKEAVTLSIPPHMQKQIPKKQKLDNKIDTPINYSQKYKFVIDRIGSNTCPVNSIPIDIDLDDNEFEVDASTFTEYSIVNKVAYLQLFRKPFTDNLVHQHLIEDNDKMKAFKKKQKSMLYVLQ